MHIFSKLYAVSCTVSQRERQTGGNRLTKNIPVFSVDAQPLAEMDKGAKFASVRREIRRWRPADWKLPRFASVSSCATDVENKIRIAKGFKVHRGEIFGRTVMSGVWCRVDAVQSRERHVSRWVPAGRKAAKSTRVATERGDLRFRIPELYGDTRAFVLSIRENVRRGGKRRQCASRSYDGESSYCPTRISRTIDCKRGEGAIYKIRI